MSVNAKRKKTGCLQQLRFNNCGPRTAGKWTNGGAFRRIRGATNATAPTAVVVTGQN